MIGSLYILLASLTVTLHVSTKYPTAKHPQAYGLTTCTGVFVSPNEILTANHCLENNRGHMWIKTSENESYVVKVEKRDKYKDLALLRAIKNISHSYTDIGKPATIEDQIYTVNSGDDYPSTYNKGIVNNLIADEEYGCLTIIHNAVILSGASGSGLFNSRGQLVGINVATIKDLSMAVDVLEIKAFLNYRA